MKTHKSCKIYYINSLSDVKIPLSASKSESNRALIINAFCKPPGRIQNLSDARDTKTMLQLLSSDSKTLDVLDAGTTMRFLTAYHAVSEKSVMLTGTERMQQRPIKLLVDALVSLGAAITYAKNPGYPPILIKPFKGQQTREINVRGDISSQYISALLMIGPTLPKGIVINLEGKIMSRPYIHMTLSLMEKFGIKVDWQGQVIKIDPQKYKSSEYTIESDWSGASYWFSLVSLVDQATIKLLGLREKSLQGDHKIVDIMDKLGVRSKFDPDGVVLSKQRHDEQLDFDFSDCPDLAQTVAVTCAAKGIHCRMTGLQSLRIKETDRIAALQTELSKIGADFIEHSPLEWELIPGGERKFPTPLFIDTYDDHRMAMAFAPLAARTDVIIENPSVVNKSYPGFWKHLEMAGSKITFQD